MKNSDPNKRVIRKPVAFNRNDPDQLKLLTYVSKLENFSGYMKGLILKDLREKQYSLYEGGKITIDLRDQQG